MFPDLQPWVVVNSTLITVNGFFIKEWTDYTTKSLACKRTFLPTRQSMEDLACPLHPPHVHAVTTQGITASPGLYMVPDCHNLG
jgi:hypothetical protein